MLHTFYRDSRPHQTFMAVRLLHAGIGSRATDTDWHTDDPRAGQPADGELDDGVRQASRKSALDMPRLNVVFLGGFPYPSGMAGTKRVQHAIDALLQYPNVKIRVIVIRQAGHSQPTRGAVHGVPYVALMLDASGWRGWWHMPALWLRTLAALRESWNAEASNVIYKYGPPSFLDALPLWKARKMGFKVACDIVEDYDAAVAISRAYGHRIKMAVIRLLTKHLRTLTDGIIVISSRLETKYRTVTDGRIPIHYRPVSIEPERFAPAPHRSDDSIRLFYAGSFGIKDGVEHLVDAFDKLAGEYGNLRLLLSGRGGCDRMRLMETRIANSPYRERIEYLGYLDDDAYYRALNAADIPCMTRIDTAYAQAGFPFKLGEFLATGKPVIASQTSDVGLLLTDRRDVLLVKPGSTDGIVEAVRYVLTNPHEAARIGFAGRARALELFDYRVQGRRLREFLLQLTTPAKAP